MDELDNPPVIIHRIEPSEMCIVTVHPRLDIDAVHHALRGVVPDGTPLICAEHPETDIQFWGVDKTTGKFRRASDG